MFGFSIPGMDAIVGAVTGQIKILTDKLGIAQSVGNALVGSAWRGAGATAFGEFLTSQYIPAVTGLIQAISGFGGAVSQGGGIFENLQSQAMSKVSNLISGFNF